MWKRVKKLWFLALGVLALPVVTLVALGRYTCGKIGQWWRKKSLWRKAVVVALLSAIPTLMVVDCVVDSCRAARRRSRVYIRNVEYVGSNLEIHYFNRGENKLFNRETNSYTLEGIEWVSNTFGDDSLVVYSDTYRYYTTSKRGYLNINTGEVVIPATEYSRAWLFSDGVAAVVKEGKVGFIDRENNVVIPFKFDYDPMTEELWNFGYMFYDGYSIMTNSEGLFGLIDKSGEWVVEPQYERIEGTDERGWRKVYNNGLYGIITNDGCMIYSPEYKSITIMDDNTLILEKEGRRWREDERGNVVVPLLYDDCHHLCYYVYVPEEDDYKEFLSPYLLYTIGDKSGVMVRDTGEVLSPAVYGDISVVGKDRFQIYDNQSGNYYQITAAELRKLW